MRHRHDWLLITCRRRLCACSIACHMRLTRGGCRVRPHVRLLQRHDRAHRRGFSCRGGLCSTSASSVQQSTSSTCVADGAINLLYLLRCSSVGGMSALCSALAIRYDGFCLSTSRYCSPNRICCLISYPRQGILLHDNQRLDLLWWLCGICGWLARIAMLYRGCGSRCRCRRQWRGGRHGSRCWHRRT